MVLAGNSSVVALHRSAVRCTVAMCSSDTAKYYGSAAITSRTKIGHIALHRLYSNQNQLWCVTMHGIYGFRGPSWDVHLLNLLVDREKVLRLRLY